MNKIIAFGVIGHPIEHSLSPVMHNSVFKHLGLGYEYLKFDVHPKDLGKFIENCKENNFIGLNVTIPHKISVIRFLDKISEEARLINAVNTIKFEDKTAIGFNTDGLGCVRALLEWIEEIKGKRILVLGAGGASRAISFQLAIEGADLLISNRTYDRALTLGNEIREKVGKRVEIVKFSHDEMKNFINDIDVLINATSVGMFPKVDEIPIPEDLLKFLNEDAVVMDIVYNPIETKLLREAKALGFKTVDGVGMLVYQGAESLRIWLDIEAPIDLMRRVVVRELGG